MTLLTRLGSRANARAAAPELLKGLPRAVDRGLFDKGRPQLNTTSPVGVAVTASVARTIESTSDIEAGISSEPNRASDGHPQHFAMTFCGFATGLRPSSLRPLRRRGLTADVLWDQGRLLVRRSQTLGDEVMNTTKQGKRYSITVPQALMAVLEWHVRTQLTTPEQEDSDLLFPSVKGSYRSPSVLNKPFADVCEAMGLGRHFSQRGLRRTFNDLARAAEVESVVTRSISGHSPSS